MPLEIIFTYGSWEKKEVWMTSA